jgi:exopolyphosphatase / guanosine-5'-triphosphate,3'-diphosphate pyrophosphatase
MTSETTGAVIAAPTTSLPEDSAILNAGLAEHGPREVAPIAQFVRYHRKGTPGLDECRPLTRDGDGDLVARCALLLRMAGQLER